MKKKRNMSDVVWWHTSCQATLFTHIYIFIYMWYTVIIIYTVNVWWSVLDSFTVDAPVGWNHQFPDVCPVRQENSTIFQDYKTLPIPQSDKNWLAFVLFRSDLNRVHNDWEKSGRGILLYATPRGFYGNLSTAKNLWSTLATSKHSRQITRNSNKQWADRLTDGLTDRLTGTVSFDEHVMHNSTGEANIEARRHMTVTAQCTSQQILRLAFVEVDV